MGLLDMFKRKENEVIEPDNIKFYYTDAKAMAYYLTELSGQCPVLVPSKKTEYAFRYQVTADISEALDRFRKENYIKDVEISDDVRMKINKIFKERIV